MKKLASELSAARFLKLYDRRKSRVRPHDDIVPTTVKHILAGDIKRWRYVERHHPGAREAWLDVGMPICGFILAASSKPERARAIDPQCYSPEYTNCQCREFVNGKWRRCDPCRRGMPWSSASTNVEA